MKSYRALPGACHTLLTADRRPTNGHALSPSEKSSVDLAEVFSRQWHSSVVAVVNSRLHGFINASRPLSRPGGTNSKRRFYKYLIARRCRNRQPLRFLLREYWSLHRRFTKLLPKFSFQFVLRRVNRRFGLIFASYYKIMLRGKDNMTMNGFSNSGSNPGNKRDLFCFTNGNCTLSSSGMRGHRRSSSFLFFFWRHQPIAGNRRAVSIMNERCAYS